MALDKFNFINNLISRFAYYIQGEQSQQVAYDAYSRVLSNKVDYEKLWTLFCNEYKDKTPPTGVQLKNFAKQCYYQNENQASKWMHVKVLNPVTNTTFNRDCFPKGTTEEQIIKTYEAKFNCKGFQIVEVW